MNEKLKEIIKKYRLTSKDIEQNIDQLELGKVCNTSCMVAFAELLVELEYTAIRMEKENEL
jgi:hypothetical protein